MGKKICKDADSIQKAGKEDKVKYCCTKCGEKAVKEKWVCKPKKLK
jgi:hypothetical protein